MADKLNELTARIEELESRLEESEQMIDAIKAGQVDAFAINSENKSEVYTLQSGDYVYRVLIEQFGEGALNVTEEGLIVYTNIYFAKLINIPYEKVIGAMITEFIDENSLGVFHHLFNNALSGQSKGEINLRVGNKVIPVYISFTSLQPNVAAVGIIITDLTEKKIHEALVLKYQNDLEFKNRELLQSNSELASFAYIASHDLQEPLRKIQTFSTRIIDKENGNLSEGTKNYFERIISASKRMKNLINALLDYSRINTSEIVFIPTDFNKILEEVKSDLNELILESGAVIKCTGLPVLYGIPHQINQLFSNLIINAIKFRKPDTKPVIKITANIVNETHPGEVQSNMELQGFWNIKVKDNGIGFEEKYAGKIFELFQRLHGRAEYEGTGIGLAICKKIVQNHGGYITADGKEGEGAVFNIYLPQNIRDIQSSKRS